MSVFQKKAGAYDENRGPITYVKLATLSKGDTYQGVYSHSYTAGQFNQTTHVFTNPDGSAVGIDGNKSMNRRMQKVKQGETVEIRYDGKEKMKGPKGVFETHSVMVSRVAEDGTITPILFEKGEKLSDDAGDAANANSFRRA